MKPTKTKTPKRLKLSAATERAYRNRDRSLDADADAPQLPPSYWEKASIGKYAPSTLAENPTERTRR